LDSIVNSGSAVLSGARNTAKGVGKDYYNDQIKPTVDTAIDTAKQEADKLAKEAKNQVNSGIDQVGQDFSDRMQENADTVRDQIDGLKIK
jgi:F0F1-type ATP synthase membrane subunit b/b'